MDDPIGSDRIRSDWIEIEALDGEGAFDAYRAEPAPGGATAAIPVPTIIVVQEIFGVNAAIRRTVDDLAAAGYRAIAPDMFWRFAPGYSADPDVPAERADAFRVRENFDLDAAIRDVAAVIRAARNAPGAEPGAPPGKIGILGYCLGGSVAFLAATRTDVDASVGFYGARIADFLDEAAAIARPLLLHFAGDDAHIPAAAVARVEAALGGHPRVAIAYYPGTGHGFAARLGERRDAAAATTADRRTAAFFAEHLR